VIRRAGRKAGGLTPAFAFPEGRWNDAPIHLTRLSLIVRLPRESFPGLNPDPSRPGDRSEAGGRNGASTRTPCRVLHEMGPDSPALRPVRRLCRPWAARQSRPFSMIPIGPKSCGVLRSLPGDHSSSRSEARALRDHSASRGHAGGGEAQSPSTMVMGVNRGRLVAADIRLRVWC